MVVLNVPRRPGFMDEAGTKRLVFAKSLFQQLQRDNRTVRLAPGSVDDPYRPLAQPSIELVVPDHVADAGLGASDHPGEHTTSNSPDAVLR
jgi:hypothetical protein